MLIDLSELLSHVDKTLNLSADLEMEHFVTRLGDYPVKDKKPMNLCIRGIDGKKVEISAEIELTLVIPCDRCLEDVENLIKINTSKEVDLSETDEQRREELDDIDYIDGTVFDAEKFAYGEILVNLPMKVLCSEDCKGICNRCGTNLNHGNCGCDTTGTDLRMAKALEVFNSFKEV